MNIYLSSQETNCLSPQIKTNVIKFTFRSSSAAADRKLEKQERSLSMKEKKKDPKTQQLALHV